MNTTTTQSFQLLRVDASSRKEGSMSRTLGDAFEQSWKAHRAGAAIVVRDVVDTPIPHIGNATIGGFFTPPEQLTPELKAATALSDALIAEIKAASDVLITTPMYNFGIPSALKAWIDQIVRIRESFGFDGSNFTGLIEGKTAHVAIAYGASGYINGGGFAAANFVEPYLRFVLGFIGFANVNVYSVESTSTDAAAAERDLVKAKSQIEGVLSAPV
jgi:FMN-dependent NADH-azoreductase